MDKIKPYLFWIICGILLLVEIMLAVTLEPVNSKKKTAMQAAKALNSEVSKLENGYGAKADTEPKPTIMIDNEKRFIEMQTDVLLTDNWMPSLQKVKEQLDTHKANV